MSGEGMWDWVTWGWKMNIDGPIVPTRPEPLAFVSEAKQELLRLIVDVQQNRNRPEDLP